MKYLILLSFVFATHGMAAEIVPLQQTPGLTPYQTIEKLYNESQAAKFSDFQLMTDSTLKWACAHANKTTPENLSKSPSIPAVYQYVETTTPGQPDNGPLFPATPAVTKTTNVIFFVDELPVDTSGVPTMMGQQHAKVTTTPTDLIQSEETDDFAGSDSFRISKNGLISFLEVYADKKDATKSYSLFAYCWKLN